MIVKDTGIIWIGEIPDSWQINKIGQLFALRNNKVSDKVYTPLSVSKGGVVPQMESVAKSDASDDRKLVLSGDFVINSRSDRKQSCGVSPLDGSVSLINLVLYSRDANKIHSPYLNYLLKNYGFAEEFYRWGHGIVADLWTTRWQEMKNIFIPIPSKKTQIALFNYMNSSIKEIDSLIELENKQIAILNEYKESVITDAVTKGLNNRQKMKNSNTNWLGMVPDHWTMKKMGWIADYKKGPFGSSLKISMFVSKSSETYKVYEQKNAIYKDDRLGDYYISPSKFKELSSFEVIPGDIIVSCAGTIGECYQLPDSCEKGIINQALMRVRLTETVLPEYFLYLFNTVISKASQLESNGSAMKNIPPFDVLKNFRIYLPDKEEQKSIVTYLNEKCADIESLIGIKKEKIKLLGEYKKSFVYECVTGKNEVVA